MAQAAALSETDICNQALMLLGAKEITSLTQATGAGAVNAGRCNRIYVPTRDAMTRIHIWNCAIVRLSVSSTDAPIGGYTAAYIWPNDPYCLRPLTVNEDPEDGILTENFKSEGRLILTDETSPIKLKYIRRLENPVLMDAAFYDALAARMAWKLAYTITGSRQIMDDMYALYQAQVEEGVEADGTEGTGDDMFDDSLADVRRE